MGLISSSILTFLLIWVVPGSIFGFRRIGVWWVGIVSGKFILTGDNIGRTLVVSREIEFGSFKNVL